MKYGLFIEKMAEDFATGQENVDLSHIKDVQHILSIHDCNKSHMSSKNEEHSTTGNVPDMEGQCYKCGGKGHLSNTCTKNVAKGQWYMGKMKMQDAQLTQASGDTTSTVDNQSSVTGTTPTTSGTNSQGTASQGAKRPFWQGLQVHKSGTIHTHSYAQTNKHMYDWILLNTCSSIDLFCS